jgi:hypothetical protein
MESRDWIQTLARAHHSQSKTSKTSVGESDALSGSVTDTETLTISGQGSVRSRVTRIASRACGRRA